MARDYAKRYKALPKKRKSARMRFYLRSLFVFSVLLLVMLAGGSSYYYYAHNIRQRTPATRLPPVSEAQSIPIKETQAKAPAMVAKEEPVEYEFYTLLPTINVPDPVQSNTPAGEQPGYWLQMAVYYSMRDASAMVDRLQLLGLDPVITERKASKADRTLYVVIMGPYPSKEAVVTRQQELKKINVTNYIFYVEPPAAPVMDTAVIASKS